MQHTQSIEDKLINEEQRSTSHRGPLSRLGQPKLQDRRSKLVCQLWVPEDEVEECRVVKVEGGEVLAAWHGLADAAHGSLEKVEKGKMNQFWGIPHGGHTTGTKEPANIIN